jgi:hypothetical protein
LRQNFEEENGLIQRHVKEAKDKTAELIKKFDLTIEKMQVAQDAGNLSKIIGRGLFDRMTGTQGNPMLAGLGSGTKASGTSG